MTATGILQKPELNISKERVGSLMRKSRKRLESSRKAGCYYLVKTTEVAAKEKREKHTHYMKTRPSGKGSLPSGNCR